CGTVIFSSWQLASSAKLAKYKTLIFIMVSNLESVLLSTKVLIAISLIDKLLIHCLTVCFLELYFFKSFLLMLIIGFTAGFFHKMDIINHNVMRDGFGHIINGQAGDANGG